MHSFAPLMFTLLDELGLSPTLMSTQCAERPAQLHGLRPRKGALRVGSDVDLCVLERGDFVFDETAVVDRPELRWSPCHLRRMRARVATTVQRGKLIWVRTQVLACPSDGCFIQRETHRAICRRIDGDTSVGAGRSLSSSWYWCWSRAARCTTVESSCRPTAAIGAPSPWCMPTSPATSSCRTARAWNRFGPWGCLSCVPIFMRGAAGRIRSTRAAEWHDDPRMGRLRQPFDGRGAAA
jgi:hypothetical protein